MLLSISSTRLFAVLSLIASLSNALPTSTLRDESERRQIGSSVSKRTSAQDYLTYAVAGINQMITYYSAADGLFSGDWWNSANAVTVLADFQQCFPSQGAAVTSALFPTVLTVAPKTYGFTNFLNGFYDDELWWALAWIQVYDVTNNVQYLDMAATIFEDAKSVWGTATCGGLWWDKAHTQNGAVENELYLTAAAKLANRLPTTPSEGYYFNEAVKAAEWIINSGLINSQNVINNGLNLQTCQNDGGIVFSYNQGILLAGLTELTWASGDATYATLANTIAVAAIGLLTDSNGILHDQCEATGCDGDEEQFKGIFGRGIQFLYQRSNADDATKARYLSFLTTNANAIWADDQVDNQLGLVWSGPTGTVTLQTQSSALDAIVGAACVTA